MRREAESGESRAEREYHFITFPLYHKNVTGETDPGLRRDDKETNSTVSTISTNSTLFVIPDET
jgi:hypothetical protein